MWNSHPPPSLLEAMGEGRAAPYAAMWVCVVRARMCMCVSAGAGLPPCVHVRPRGRSLCICLVRASVRALACVHAHLASSGLCVSVRLPVFVVAAGSSLPPILSNVLRPPVRVDWSDILLRYLTPFGTARIPSNSVQPQRSVQASAGDQACARASPPLSPSLPVLQGFPETQVALFPVIFPCICSFQNVMLDPELLH